LIITVISNDWGFALKWREKTPATDTLRTGLTVGRGRDSGLEKQG